MSFVWKKDQYPDKNFPEGRFLGVMAQDVEALFPELVSTDDDGFKVVRYNHFIPVFIESIKEQQQLLNKQNEKIDHLENELALLKSQLDALIKKGQNE